MSLSCVYMVYHNAATHLPGHPFAQLKYFQEVKSGFEEWCFPYTEKKKFDSVKLISLGSE